MKVRNAILRLRMEKDPLTLDDVAKRLSIPVALLDSVYGVQVEDPVARTFTVHLDGEVDVDTAQAEVFSNPGIGLQGPRR